MNRYIHTCICTHANESVYARIYAYTHIRTRMCTYTYTHLYVYMHICTDSDAVCVRAYVLNGDVFVLSIFMLYTIGKYIHIYIYVCVMHISIYTYVHIGTYIMATFP